MATEEAAMVLQDPAFEELFEEFETLAEQAENEGEVAADLPAEDDEGPIEYKLKMCGVDQKKLVNRTTQMAYRLTQGSGEAFYEIGVHDNGKMIGIEQEEILETMIVLFHICTQLEAKLEICKVRLGTRGYSVQLKVTNQQ